MYQIDKSANDGLHCRSNAYRTLCAQKINHRLILFLIHWDYFLRMGASGAFSSDLTSPSTGSTPPPHHGSQHQSQHAHHYFAAAAAGNGLGVGADGHHQFAAAAHYAAAAIQHHPYYQHHPGHLGGHFQHPSAAVHHFGHAHQLTSLDDVGRGTGGHSLHQLTSAGITRPWSLVVTQKYRNFVFLHSNRATGFELRME